MCVCVCVYIYIDIYTYISVCGLTLGSRAADLDLVHHEEKALNETEGGIGLMVPCSY